MIYRWEFQKSISWVFNMCNILKDYQENQQSNKLDLFNNLKILELLMIARFIRVGLPLTLPTTNSGYQFVIMKMIKRKLKKQDDKYQPKPNAHAHTYNPNQPNQSENENQQEDDDEPQYDFFNRQKQIDLNKDFRKLKLESEIIPQDIGRGGFDEVVYWSQSAKTPQQVLDLVRVFNRIPYPKKIEDLFTFQEFMSKVSESVYLSSTLEQLQQYALFGLKFTFSEDIYWKKIQEKTIRLHPQTQQNLNNCIQIAYVMSKVKKGQQIFSTLSSIFKKTPLSVQHTCKLLITYYNIQQGDKEWINQLKQSLVNKLEQLDKSLFGELLVIFKELRSVSSEEEKKIVELIQKNIDLFDFKQICIAGGFIGHSKMDKEFWGKFQQTAAKILQKKKIKTQRDLVLILQLLSSYSLSTQFARKYLLENLKANNNELLMKSQPDIRSYAAKVLFIYELEKEGEEIEFAVQSSIMKEYNKLQNVDLEVLIKVLRDYAVTRNGSRQFYIFIEEVIKALFDDVKKDLQKLEQLYKIYEKSNLCTPGLLEQISFYLE